MTVNLSGMLQEGPDAIPYIKPTLVDADHSASEKDTPETSQINTEDGHLNDK